MPNDNFDYSAQKTVVVPVMHPSGEVHNIEFPADTPIADFHAALSSADYEHPALNAAIEAAQKQPTAEGALENSQAFKAAARKAWNSVAEGDLPQEAGFMVDRNGNPSAIQSGQEINSAADKGSLTLNVPPGTFALVHTHPRPTMSKQWTQQPSQADINTATKNKENVYVVSSTGLWLAEPSGKVTQVFNRNDWMNSKKSR